MKNRINHPSANGRFFPVQVYLVILMTGVGFLSGCNGSFGGGREESPLLSKGASSRVQKIYREPAPPPTEKGTLTLEEAIDESLAASPRLGQIERRIDAAGEQVRQAESSFYPRMVFSEDYNITDNPVFALMSIINQRRLRSDTNFNKPGQQQNFATRFQAEVPIFEGGRRWHDRKAALHQKDSIKSDLLAAQNQLVATVTETYYRWLQALDFIQVAERALESAKTNERLAEARIKQGTALPSELLRLKTKTAQSQSELVGARMSARRLQAAMERLLARRVSEKEIPLPTPQNLPSSPDKGTKEPSMLVEEALEQRPELKAVHSLVLASRERIRSARGEYLPTINAKTFYQWDSEQLDNFEDSWLVGVNLTWNLFDGGMRSSKIREARFKLKELQARGEQLALDIALEVVQAATGVQEAAEKIKVAEQGRLWARQGLKEFRHLYENEVITVDALLQAEVDWKRAEVSYTAALFDGKISQATLRKALGEFAEWLEKHHE
jgi:outer membrane protein